MVESLFSDDYVCVFRARHPWLTTPISVEQLVRAHHVLVKQSTGQKGIVDAWLELKGFKREIVTIVTSSAEAIWLAQRTDLATMAPRSYMTSVEKNDELVFSALPFEHPRILYKMAWHERTDRHPARRWLRTKIRQVVQETCGPPA